MKDIKGFGGNQMFQQYQSVQTRNAIDHFVVAQVSAIIEEVVVKQQKQQELVAAVSRWQLAEAEETERQAQQEQKVAKPIPQLEQVVAESSGPGAQAPEIVGPIPQYLSSHY